MILAKPAWRGRYLPWGQGEMIVAPVRLNRRGGVRPAGLGDTAPANPVCTGFWSNLDPMCWGYQIGSAAIAGGSLDYNLPGYAPPPAPLPPPAPVATPANPAPLTLPPSSGGDAVGTVDATIAAGAAANQQNLLNFFATQPDCTQSLLPALGICDSTIYIAGAVAGLLAFVSWSSRRRR